MLEVGQSGQILLCVNSISMTNARSRVVCFALLTSTDHYRSIIKSHNAPSSPSTQSVVMRAISYLANISRSTPPVPVRAETGQTD